MCSLCTIRHPRSTCIFTMVKRNKGYVISCASSKKNGDYRIYSIKRPGRLLNFWTLRVGAYSKLGAY